MRAQEFITEITRRDLLKGLGAGMIATGAGSVLYDKFKEPRKPPETKKPKINIQPITAKRLEKLLLDTALSEAKWTPEELAQFMAQCAHETGNFETLVERGTPRYFKRKYGSDTYKGRGFIQLTGKKNYKLMGLDKNPHEAAEPKAAAAIAVEWWKNQIAPRLADFSNTAHATRLINGPGMYGLDQRQNYFKKYMDSWHM